MQFSNTGGQFDHSNHRLEHRNPLQTFQVFRLTSFTALYSMVTFCVNQSVMNYTKFIQEREDGRVQAIELLYVVMAAT